MKKLCVFAHYDKDNIIDDYVVYYLNELSNIVVDIVFVSVSKLSKKEIKKINGLCLKIICRENIGYDFLSYRVGLESVNFIEYEQIIICNDSVYGPIRPLKNFFKKMNRVNCDFWGITESYEISYHLQSYFLVFNSKLIKSAQFKSFWKSTIPLNNKNYIIDKYEIGLTKFLIINKFIPSAFIKINFIDIIYMIISNYKTISLYKIVYTLFFYFKNNKFKNIFKNNNKVLCNLNPTHYFWKGLILKDDMPFVKIELLRDNPEKINIKDIYAIISTVSDYNLDIIINHLKRMRRFNKTTPICPNASIRQEKNRT